MKRTITTLLICCILGVLQSWSHPYKVGEIPMVHLQDKTRYVSNPDNLLSPQSVATMDSILYALEQRSGIETLVVAVKEIDGGDPFSFAIQLGKEQGVGKKETNNGLVILLVTEQRTIQFVTGYGLEGVLPDAICKRIQNRYMNKYLAKGDWDTGMVNGIRAVNQYLADYQDGTEKLNDAESISDYYPLLFIALVLGAFAIYAYSRSRKKFQCPRCKHNTLRRTSSQLISNLNGIQRRRVVYTCSHCGYTTVREEDSDDDNDGLGGRGGGPIIFGPMGGFGRGGSGGGISGGSFGGGDFGGGGADSNF